MKQLNESLRTLYLDYVNNYLTLEKMAQDYSMTERQLRDLLFVGKDLHEQYVAELDK